MMLVAACRPASTPNSSRSVPPDEIAPACAALPKRHDTVKFDEKTMSVPKVVERVPPRMTERIRAERLRGTVAARCIVGERGEVEGCCVESGVDGLNEPVLAALREWRFQPYVWKGRAIKLEYPIQIGLFDM